MSDVATQVDPRRRRLIAVLQSGDAYGFLGAAENYLRDVAADAEICELTVRTYAALGLASAARQVLQRAVIDPEARDQLEKLIPSADQRISWSKFDAQFQANLEVFDRRTGLGNAVFDEWRAQRGKLQLFACTDGNLQVLSRKPPAWLPGLFAHNNVVSVEKLRAEWDGKVIRSLLLNGIGLGFTARDVIDASRKTFLDFSAPVLLVERSLPAWAVVLHLHDWRERLAEPRVILCAGPDALATLDAELENVDRMRPCLLNAGPSWPEGIPDDVIVRRLESIDAWRDAETRRLYDEILESTKDRDPSWWARRFAAAGASQPPLTIMGVTSRYTTVLQYTMRDLLAAFERHGCRTHLFMEADDHAHFAPIRVLRDMQRVKPDLIVKIDHLRREFENVYPETIPGLCWIQDQLTNLFRPEAGRGVQPLEFVIGHGFPDAILKFNYPPDRFCPCIIPTDPGQMLDPHETDQDLAPYRCDVMYATNASSPPDKFHQAYRKRAGESLRPLIDAVFDSLRAIIAEPQFSGDYDYAGLLGRVEAELGIQIKDAALRADVIATLMRGVADISLRERTVRAAARWADEAGARFHLYGRGWGERPEFSRYAKGFVKHGRELGRAFRAATISLHAGTNPALHQRVLDGLCAGGFFLIQEKPSDTANEISMAVYRYLLEERPNVPFVMKAEYLPAPHDERYREMLRVRGVDPERGLLFDQSQYMFIMFHGGRGRLPMASGYWPQYQQVVFRDPDHLVERIDFFLQHAEQRRELAREMRAVVLANFTYDALVRNTLAFVQDGLAGARQAAVGVTPGCG